MIMAEAVWNGVVLAKSDQVQIVEGNVYFPPHSLNMQYFRPADTRTVCAWKGEAHYYDIEVEGKVNPDAAWYYPSPHPAAANIRDHVAFWRGVVVNHTPED